MAHYHISYNELLWGTPWPVWQRILADAPGYEYDSKGGEKKENNDNVPTPDDPEKFAKYFNDLAEQAIAPNTIYG